MRSEVERVRREWPDGANRRSVASSRPAADADAAKDETVGESGVHGRVVWDAGTGATQLLRYQVHSYALGDTGVSKGMSYHVRSDREGNYKFYRISAGPHKMTDMNGAATSRSVERE